MKLIAITLWGIMFFLSVMSLFVFIHEGVHLIRADKPQMMCLGFGENFGRAYHLNEFDDRPKEELIANSVAFLIIVVYIVMTYFMITNLKGGNNNEKE